jgi:putative spermidine/putrescine transport system ATP-binding protein
LDGGEGLTSVGELETGLRTEAADSLQHAARPVAARPPKLLVDDVAVHYGQTAALDGLSLVVEHGEFVSLLGPSGCGKTTLLGVIAGLLRPSRGRVFLDGRDVTAMSPESRPLNMVFQHLALFPHLSVGANVGFGLSLRKLPRADVRERVAEMLAIVGLAGYESRSTHQLSGGQQQRVALARALITEPSILLLDEPLGALDFAIRKEMQSELKSLQRRLAVTFIFVTHDQTEAMAMSDRVVLMRDGMILQDASPFETYTNPANAFAAGFVGDTNLVQGRVASATSSGSVIVLADDLVLETLAEVRVGASVAVSIRPERIRISTESSSSGIPGEIVAESFFGADIVAEVDTALGKVKVREPAHPGSLGRTGQRAHLIIDPAYVRVFELD